MSPSLDTITGILWWGANIVDIRCAGRCGRRLGVVASLTPAAGPLISFATRPTCRGHHTSPLAIDFEQLGTVVIEAIEAWWGPDGTYRGKPDYPPVFVASPDGGTVDVVGILEDAERRGDVWIDRSGPSDAVTFRPRAWKHWASDEGERPRSLLEVLTNDRVLVVIRCGGSGGECGRALGAIIANAQDPVNPPRVVAFLGEPPCRHYVKAFEGAGVDVAELFRLADIAAVRGGPPLAYVVAPTPGRPTATPMAALRAAEQAGTVRVAWMALDGPNDALTL